ncbi:MAG: hypothetical protein KDD50_12975 [Bdellovibrionales bacterium]|nr:hypothetical protein [Bdellovibrionales bacterium]
MTFVKRYILMALLIGTSGCVEYTHPLCGASNSTSLNNFAGEYVSRIFGIVRDTEEFRFDEQIINVKEISKSLYEIDHQQVVACNLNGQVWLEFKTEYGTYKGVMADWIENKRLTYFEAGISSEDLSKNGVKYKLVEREMEAELMKASLSLKKLVRQSMLKRFNDDSEDKKYLAIIIENENDQANAVLAKGLKAVYIGTALDKLQKKE